MIQKKILISIIIITLFTFTNLISQQWGAYTFYSAKGSTNAYLIDTNGTIYHTWTFNSQAKTSYSSYLLKGGTVIRTVDNIGNKLQGGGMTGRIQKVDWDGNVLWDFVYSSSSYCLHHDICPLPNGNVLMISYDVKTSAQAKQAGSSRSISIWSDKIIEVKPTGANTGEVVWEWCFWDHLCQNYDAGKDNYVNSIQEHPELLNINYSLQKDWLHLNGIDYNAELDEIVISSHFLNELYVIDHSTTTEEAAGHTGGASGKGGDILYRWGNPAAYGASGSKIFNVPHDAHWVPAGNPKANNLVVFNNNGVSFQKSCVDFIEPPYDGFNYTLVPGSAYFPSTYSYRHICNGHTMDEGGSQQLPNGNMLVCIAQSGLLYEIDSLGNMLWSKTITSGGPGGSISQAFRYSSCYVHGTIAPAPTITQNDNFLKSSDGTTYQWFFNGIPINEANEQIHTPAKNGSYQVQITNSDGCESELSASYKINNFTRIAESGNNKGLRIFPNPTSGLINIERTSYDYGYEIVIYNVLGNVLYKTNNEKTIDLAIFENGVYYIIVKSNNYIVLKEKIILIK